MDILTGGNLIAVKVANMDPIYWSVRSSKRRVDDGEYRYFSQLRVYAKLAQHPSNNISILRLMLLECLQYLGEIIFSKPF